MIALIALLIAAYCMAVVLLGKCMAINHLEADHAMTRTDRHAALEFIQLAAQVEPPPTDRRLMHWAVQRVDEILAGIHLAGITHAEAAARLAEIGVCRNRVQALLAGERRAA